MSPTRSEAENRNRVYETMATGTGMGQVDAIQMVLANNKIAPPESSEQFCGCLGGVRHAPKGSGRAGPTVSAARATRHGPLDSSHEFA